MIADAITSYLILYWLFVERKHRRSQNNAITSGKPGKLEKQISQKQFVILAFTSIATQLIWIALYCLWFKIIKTPDAHLFENEMAISILLLQRSGIAGLPTCIAGLLALWFMRFYKK